MNIESECPICFEYFNKEDIAYLSCGHSFHFNCVSYWLTYDYKKGKNYNKLINCCPICNKETEIVTIENNKKKIINNNKEKEQFLKKKIINTYTLQVSESTAGNINRQDILPTETKKNFYYCCCKIS